MPPSNRTYRTSAFSRERNRMHARKTVSGAFAVAAACIICIGNKTDVK
jgi:hypothetical protein